MMVLIWDELLSFAVAKIIKLLFPFPRGEKLLFLQPNLSTMTFKEVLRKLNNRYVYATLVFLVVILFIDQFNLFEQIRLHRLLKDQKQLIEYYESEITESKEYLDALQNDTATMEKVAREQYMMKRDNEVVYLIETQEWRPTSA